MEITTSTPAILFVAAYFCGSIPFGLLLGKLFGATDVRKTGSGNIGATNVARSIGLGAGILTLVLDAAKGAAPVWLARSYFPEHATFQILAGLGALVGHCFPVWLKFRGGKGVATAAGFFGVLCWPAALGALLVFVLVVSFTRYVSLASISAAASMPLLVYFLWAPHYAPPLAVSLGTLAAAILIVYKHDANLQRLVEGTEPKFSLRKTPHKHEEKEAE
ncbi:MAG: glycerol-3-phosphate 1-O-acyltransferase PlsY [Acidobacteria bacterium]|nr:glycerol-3-phosphate 1-O-acyltransferase PlsY [Acidobacteriota bacterium]MBS1867073.1 glycerol-3-phosphate 1-O-acyltransferase PlsY [Acidobacteriota bacterium]